MPNTSAAWLNDASGNWSVNGNWNSANYPSGAGNTASFIRSITLPRTVTLDVAGGLAIGNLAFSDGGNPGDAWTIGGSNTLTLNNNASSPSISTVTPATISAPLAGTNGFSKTGSSELIVSGDSSSLSGAISVGATSGYLLFRPTGATANIFSPSVATTISVPAGRQFFTQPNTPNAVVTLNGTFSGAGLLSHQGDLQSSTTVVAGSISALAEAAIFGIVSSFNTTTLPTTTFYFNSNTSSAVLTLNLTLPTNLSSGMTVAMLSGPTPTQASVSIFNSSGAGAFITSGGIRREDTSTGVRTLRLGGTTSGNEINGNGSNLSSTVVKSPLEKLSTGSWSLGGDNDVILAGTTISDGTLKVTNSKALGNSGDAVLLSALTSILELSGGVPGITIPKVINPGRGTIRSSAGPNTLSGGITLIGNTTFDVTAGSLTASGLITSSGSPTFTKTGSEVLTLSNSANSFTSNPSISAGTLAVTSIAASGTASALGAGTGLTLSGSGVLRYTGSTGATLSRTLTAGSITGGFENNGSGSLAVTAGSITGTSTVKLGGTGAGQYNTLAVPVAAGGFTKEGPGRWISTAVNNLSGTTTVSAGTLMAAPDAASASAKLLGGNVTVAAGAKIQTSSDNSQLGRNSYINLTFAGTVGTPARIRIGGSAVSPTVQMSGNLTLPASGTTTFDLSADVFKTPGEYTLVEFTGSGAVVNWTGGTNITTGSTLATGRSASFAYDSGSTPKTLKVTIS